MRSNRKRPGYKEVRFWADPETAKRLSVLCRAAPQNMPDLIEEMVKAQLPVTERNREHEKLMGRFRQMTVDACARDVHTATHKVAGQDRCTNCDADVTERLRWEI